MAAFQHSRHFRARFFTRPFLVQPERSGVQGRVWGLDSSLRRQGPDSSLCSPNGLGSRLFLMQPEVQPLHYAARRVRGPDSNYVARRVWGPDSNYVARRVWGPDSSLHSQKGLGSRLFLTQPDESGLQTLITWPKGSGVQTSLVPRPHPKIGKGAWCYLQIFPYVLCQQSSFGVEESRSSIANYNIPSSII